MSPRLAAPLLLLALAVAWTWPAAVAGDALLVGRHFDLPGTVWFIDAAPRVLPGLHDPLTAWPAGADYDRPDSYLLLALGGLLQGLSAVRVHNLLQVVGVWTSAWAAEAFARAVGARFPASLVAGAAYGFCGLAASALLEGHVYLALNPWLPLFGWAWLRATGPDGRAAHGLAAAGAWSLALLTSAYVGLAASLLALGLLAAGGARRSLRPGPVLAAALPVAAVGGLYLWAFSGGSMHGGAPWVADDFPSRAAFLQSRSADVVNLAAATAEVDRVGHSLSAWLPGTALALFLAAPVALRGQRLWRGLALTGVAALVLSLGPAIASPTRAWLPLPLGLVAGFDAADLLRFPVRLGWAWALCAGVVAARVATVLLERGGRWAWPLAAAMLLDVFFWGGLPTRQRTQLADAPSAYAGEGAVLDLYPEQPRGPGEWNAWSQALACLYQVEHGRPIVDDCVAPYPEDNPRMALQRSVTGALLRGEPVRPILEVEDVRTVALHPDLFTPGDRARLSEGLAALDGAPRESRDGGERVVAYAVGP